VLSLYSTIFTFWYSCPCELQAQRLCEEIASDPNSGAVCGGVISVSSNSFQLRQGNVPQFLASSSETSYSMTCNVLQRAKVMASSAAFPQNCRLGAEAPFDEQLGKCLFDLGMCRASVPFASLVLFESLRCCFQEYFCGKRQTYMGARHSPL